VKVKFELYLPIIPDTYKNKATVPQLHQYQTEEYSPVHGDYSSNPNIQARKHRRVSKEVWPDSDQPIMIRSPSGANEDTTGYAVMSISSRLKQPDTAEGRSLLMIIRNIIRQNILAFSTRKLYMSLFQEHSKGVQQWPRCAKYAAKNQPPATM